MKKRHQVIKQRELQDTSLGERQKISAEMSYRTQQSPTQQSITPNSYSVLQSKEISNHNNQISTYKQECFILSSKLSYMMEINDNPRQDAQMKEFHKGAINYLVATKQNSPQNQKLKQSTPSGQQVQKNQHQIDHFKLGKIMVKIQFHSQKMQDEKIQLEIKTQNEIQNSQNLENALNMKQAQWDQREQFFLQKIDNLEKVFQKKTKLMDSTMGNNELLNQSMNLQMQKFSEELKKTKEQLSLNERQVSLLKQQVLIQMKQIKQMSQEKIISSEINNEQIEQINQLLKSKYELQEQKDQLDDQIKEFNENQKEIIEVLVPEPIPNDTLKVERFLNKKIQQQKKKLKVAIRASISAESTNQSVDQQENIPDQQDNISELRSRQQTILNTVYEYDSEEEDEDSEEMEEEEEDQFEEGEIASNIQHLEDLSAQLQKLEESKMIQIQLQALNNQLSQKDEEIQQLQKDLLREQKKYLDQGGDPINVLGDTLSRNIKFASQAFNEQTVAVSIKEERLGVCKDSLDKIELAYLNELRLIEFELGNRFGQIQIDIDHLDKILPDNQTLQFLDQTQPSQTDIYRETIFKLQRAYLQLRSHCDLNDPRILLSDDEIQKLLFQQF